MGTGRGRREDRAVVMESPLRRMGTMEIEEGCGEVVIFW
jgi:hypothetical protein